MSDSVSRAERSRIMASVHSRDTKPEMAVRRALHSAGFRYRLHMKALPGKPDILLPRYSTAVFVHGCFWHGHQCKRFRWPVSNGPYWRAKIERNIKRDKSNSNALGKSGWKIHVIWECELMSGIVALISGLRETSSNPI
jgi:DNA mismatch endonuclease (patch repair protein)